MSRPIVKIQFLGGVATEKIGLTGSCTLVTVMQGDRTTKTLIDVGLVQCGSQYFFQKNLEILQTVNPKNIDVVILTHAHIDHVGRLPILIKRGFKGRIFCTNPTADLIEIMLNDTAKIMAIDSRNINRKIRKNPLRSKKPSRSNYRKLHNRELRKRCKSAGRVEALYDANDVKEVLELVKYRGCGYHIWMQLDRNIFLKLYQSGHVLGGAICVIKVKETGAKDIYLGFSGDIGREDGIILPPPEIVEEPLNCWVTESTYGGKIHPLREDEVNKLIHLVKEAIAAKGVIIIPSFALERAQEILYLLSHYIEIGEIPKVTIYLDAPMATKITDIFSAHWDKGMFSDQHMLGFNPFDIKQNQWFKIISKQDDSKALVGSPGPYIVIAGSGACDAGRVREHLRVGLEKENTFVFLVGYMFANSLGRKLKENATFVRINNKEIKVKSRIVAFDAFSAHADGQWLVSYTKQIINRFDESGGLKQYIFINHGENKNATLLKDDIIESMNYRRGLTDMIFIPNLNQEFIISE